MNDKNEYEFYTHWAGTPESEDTWEPAMTFIAGCNSDWLEFCWANNVEVGVVEAMAIEREGAWD